MFQEISLSLSLSLYIYIYIYKERKRDLDYENQIALHLWLSIKSSKTNKRILNFFVANFSVIGMYINPILHVWILLFFLIDIRALFVCFFGNFFFQFLLVSWMSNNSNLSGHIFLWMNRWITMFVYVIFQLRHLDNTYIALVSYIFFACILYFSSVRIHICMCCNLSFFFLFWIWKCYTHTHTYICFVSIIEIHINELRLLLSLFQVQ